MDSSCVSAIPLLKISGGFILTPLAPVIHMQKVIDNNSNRKKKKPTLLDRHFSILYFAESPTTSPSGKMV